MKALRASPRSISSRRGEKMKVETGQRRALWVETKRLSKRCLHCGLKLVNVWNLDKICAVGWNWIILTPWIEIGQRSTQDNELHYYGFKLDNSLPSEWKLDNICANGQCITTWVTEKHIAIEWIDICRSLIWSLRTNSHIHIRILSPHALLRLFARSSALWLI